MRCIECRHVFNPSETGLKCGIEWQKHIMMQWQDDVHAVARKACMVHDGHACAWYGKEGKFIERPM